VQGIIGIKGIESSKTVLKIRIQIIPAIQMWPSVTGTCTGTGSSKRGR
jgi:hypothetical protein